MTPANHWRALVGFLGAACLLLLTRTAAGASTEEALEKLEHRRGIFVVLGDATCDRALDLVRKSEGLIYVQLPDASAVDKARRAAFEAGFDATRLQIDAGSLERLHLADNLADALIAVGEAATLAPSEALRVVRPGGWALLGETLRAKPFPPGMDDWTHPYHGPDNNTLSADRLARAPYLSQFHAEPRYGPAPQAAVASGGRIFKAFGHVAWHEREEPWLNTLVAFGGFNGTLLWKHALPEGLMVHRNTFIATPDVVYVGDDRSCKVLDARTGMLVREIRPPEDVTEGTFWKWMALVDGTLYAVVGEQEQKDPAMRWRRTEHGWPWDRISEGHTQPEHPWGFGRSFLALDPSSGKVLWHYHEDEPADCRAVCMKGGRIFAFRFGAYLTCLDAKTGEVVWRRTKQEDPALFEALGEPRSRQGWQTNWRTVAYLKASDDALYFAGPQMSKLIALSTEDGSVLWEHPYDNFQVVIYPDALVAISGPWGQNRSLKLEPLTGRVLQELPTGRRACTRPTGTTDSLLYRAMGGSVRLDLDAGQPRWLSPMRPPCHDGVTVANGLLYWWPYVCDCQLTLNGLTCLGPAGDFDFTPGIDPAARLQSGEGDPGRIEELPSSSADWPTFRADNARTAVSRARVPATAGQVWTSRPAAPRSNRLTAPVAAGGLAFVAGSDGAVRAMEAATGRERWRVLTGGEIRIPPTVWQGRVLTGSGDGYVYAFEAATGRLLWRFRAAPVERKIPVYGKLLSTWPAASGVLVEDGTAYVAAGLVNYDGTYVYALDASTGRLLWCNDTSGHLDPEAQTGVSVQGHLLLHRRKLYLAGGNAVSPAVYDIRQGRCLNDPRPLARCESTSPRGWELFLVGHRVIACGAPFYARPDLPVYDHTVTKKLLHSSNGERDIVWIDNRKIQCFPPLAPEVLHRCVSDERVPRHITQAWGEFRSAGEPLWEHDCPGSLTIAVAPNAVVLADSRSVQALDIEEGAELWKLPLPAPPVPWGLAVDRDGRTIVTLVDGRVIALGRKRREGPAPAGPPEPGRQSRS